MLKRICFLLLIIFLVPVKQVISQAALRKLVEEVSILASRNATGSLTYEKIEGSPYYSDEFVDGVIYLRNGNNTPLPLRYDLFQDEIEFKSENKILWLNKKDVEYISLGDETLIVEPVAVGSSGRLAYFFVQDTGKYSLYVKRKANFEPYVPPGGYSDAVPDRFTLDNDAYYLKQEGMLPEEISSKKALRTMLKDNSQALDYIKKTRLRVQKAEDLRALTEFLNSQ